MERSWPAACLPTWGSSSAPRAPPRGSTTDRTSCSSWLTRCASRARSRTACTRRSSSCGDSCRTSSSCTATGSSSTATTAPATPAAPPGRLSRRACTRIRNGYSRPAPRPARRCNRPFPTYGRLLQAFGYETPYVGKWHLSNPPPPPSTDGYLANYGFTGFTNPDPVGTNGQGAAEDGNIADMAVQWLQRQQQGRVPVLPHRQLRQPARQAVLLGGLRGRHVRAAVQRPALQAVHRRLRVGGRRGQSTGGRISGVPAQLGVVCGPGQARKARHPAGHALISGARLGRGARRCGAHRLLGPTLADGADSSSASGSPRSTTGSAASTCTRSF